MSFDLRLRYIGLAVYVPQGEEAMNVLLPATAGHQHEGHHGNGGHDHGRLPAGRGGVTGNELAVPSDGEGATATLEAPEDADGSEEPSCGVSDEQEPAEARRDPNEVHFARIVYDVAYEDPKSTQLARKYRIVDFTGRVLKLFKGENVQTGETLDPNLTDELPLLNRVIESVDPRLVTDPPGEELAGRVTVNVGALTRYELGAAFHLNGDENAQRMTIETEWTIRGITSQVPESKDEGAGLVPGFDGAVMTGAAGTPERRLPPLYPISQIIELMVFNAVASEFPPEGPFEVRNEQGDALHFGAYLKLARVRNDVRDATPRMFSGVKFVEVEPLERGDELPGKGGPQRPGFTCVQARATLG